MMTEMGNETPSLLDLIKESIRVAQLELNTMLPATVVSYDPATQTAEVQPSLKRTSIVPPSVDSRPRLKDVPVVFPRAGQGGAYFPLEEGDPVMLLMCQRSLDDWIDEGGEVEVRDTRLHDLTDAVIIPGMFPLSGAISSPKAAYTIDSRKVWIGDSEGSGAPAASLPESEVLQALAKILELFETPLVSAMGPVNFDPTVAAQFAAIKTMLEELSP